MYILQKSTKKTSSRAQIGIKKVQDGILILPNHQYRACLRISSINFELKSEAEQDALVDNYQSFLNALPCAVQILVRIREVDMDRYLEDFSSAQRSERQPVYREQIEDYTGFVSSLVSTNKILARHFFVVLPYREPDDDFEVAKEQLTLYADIVSKGLAKLGMQSYPLSSLEQLDLFYSFYNPGQAKRQPITEQTLELLNRSYL